MKLSVRCIVAVFVIHLSHWQFAQTTTAGLVCFGTANTAYLVWLGENGLSFKTSHDKGQNWDSTARILFPLKNGNLYSVDGRTLQGLPEIVCNTGQGLYRGRIYLCWSDEKHGSKNKDVFLAYSDDEGNTWSDAILVTYRPNHHEQFRPSLAQDTATGKLSIVYFDKQNYGHSGLADVYLAQSANGGLKFDYYKLNQFPVEIKDRIPLILKCRETGKGSLTVAWTTLNPRLGIDTVFALVDKEKLNAYNVNDAANEITIERSFAFASKINIHFKSPHDCIIDGIITKPLDPTFEKQAFKNLACKKGGNTIRINTKQLKLKRDNYILTFYYSGRNSFVWLIKD